MKVLLTGSGGMLGSSILRKWQELRPNDEIRGLTRGDVDLTDRRGVSKLVGAFAPDAVIHAAAKVDGIAAQIAHPTGYLLENLLIDSNVISAALEARVPELMYISSAVIYPQNYRQPLVEDDLLAGTLEPANEGYSIAKIAGTKLCDYISSEFGLAYRVAVPSNIYGPKNTVGGENAHLIEATLRKVLAAKLAGDNDVVVWGDGQSRREFVFAEDVSSWLVSQIGKLDAWPSRLNLGSGLDHTIDEYYDVAKQVVGFNGNLIHDVEKPSGVRQRLLDSSQAKALGWRTPTTLEQGMRATFDSMTNSTKEL
jgi:GDP-L-fucose synthase